MKEGVPLVGAHDHPKCYPLKIKLASTTEAGAQRFSLAV